MERGDYCRASYLMANILRQDDVKIKLDALKKHDTDSFYHSIRVCLYSLQLGLKNDVELVVRLGRSGALHDIGKLHVPQRILQKKGPLSEVEKNVMNEHPRWGFFELQGDNYSIERKVAVGHHEQKKDGYPRTDSGKIIVGDTFGQHVKRKDYDEQYVLFNQIIAVADMYDALAHKRSYKPKMVKEEIEKILREQFIGCQKYVDQILSQHSRDLRRA